MNSLNSNNMNLISEPIISVKEARKILGKTYDEYPDDVIERLIMNLDGVMHAYIKSVPKY